jgi:hypothetical protein
MAKLYHSEFGLSVRADDDHHGTDEMIEITPEQGVALALGHIAQAIDNLYTVLDDKLGKR